MSVFSEDVLFYFEKQFKKVSTLCHPVIVNKIKYLGILNFFSYPVHFDQRCDKILCVVNSWPQPLHRSTQITCCDFPSKLRGSRSPHHITRYKLHHLNAEFHSPYNSTKNPVKPTHFSEIYFKIFR